MNFIQYVPLALRTVKLLPHALQVQHAQLGALTEIGEFADAVKKNMVYNKRFDKINGAEEIGDIAWYLNLYCDAQAIHPKLVLEWLSKPAEDTGSMLELTLALGGMVGALCISEEERGVGDIQILSVIFALLNTLCVKHLDTTFDKCLYINIAKLAKRYEGDIYSDFAALNRDLPGERAILEG